MSIITAKKRGREDWIDVVKGIGILLVIYGHAAELFPNDAFVGMIKTFIYSFHMPLFFFISGYLYNYGKYQSLKKYISRRFNSLLIPYAWFYLFSLTVTSIVLFYDKPHGLDIAKFIRTREFYESAVMAFGYATTTWLASFNNTALWFLPCLFLTGGIMIVLYTVCRQNIKAFSLLLAAISLIGYAENQYVLIALPWGIDIALTGVVFYGAGFIIKIYGRTLIEKSGISITHSDYSRVLAVAVAAASLYITIISSHINGDVNLSGRQQGMYIYYYAAAFSGIFSCVFFAKLFSSLKPLIYLGRNSLVLFGTHLIVLNIVRRGAENWVLGIISQFLNITQEYFIPSYLNVNIVFIMTLLLTVPLVFVINLISSRSSRWGI